MPPTRDAATISMGDEAEKSAERPFEEAILELNFVPSWARRPAKANPYAESAYAREEGEQSQKSQPRRRRDRVPRMPSERRIAPSRAPVPKTRPAAAVRVHFIPERRPLGAVVHRIRATRRAFPLSELASLFLTRPEFHHVKIEGESSRAGRECRLHQCHLCGAVFTKREAALDHVAIRHAERWFEARETEIEPPSGQFPCVMRTPSGRLIGPPNHHSFPENLRQAHEAEAPEMPLEKFRLQLEPLRDHDAIEQWKREASRTTLYHSRETPDAPPRPWAEARAWIRQTHAPQVVRDVERAVVPAPVAMALEDESLREAIREAWARENRFPATLMFALRPALRHMGLHLFKADDFHTFVTAVAPMPLDPDRVIPPIREALNYLSANPGCTRDQMVRNLFPGRKASDPDLSAFLGHLHWLVDKGHVIEFFDGTLSVPRHRNDVSPSTRPGAASSGRRSVEDRSTSAVEFGPAEPRE